MTTSDALLLGKRQRENDTRNIKGRRPEKEFLSSLLFDDVELVVVPQGPGHFLIGHVVSVLSKEITQHNCVLQHLLWLHVPFFAVFLFSPPFPVFIFPVNGGTQAPGAHLVVSPETCQSVGVNHPEHQAVPVFPSDVFLVTVIAQKLIHIVPQQSTLWP